MKSIILSCILLIIAIFLCGCNELYITSEEFEGDVNFTIEEIIVTKTLEVYDFWRDENKIETSLDKKYVIITLNIQNNEDSWLALKSLNNGLIDDKCSKYTSEMYIDINGSIYTVQQLTLIGEGESFGMGVYIPSNTTQLKKIVYTIPPDRQPTTLNLMFGLSSNEFDNVINWYEKEITL